nr:type II toxin-antitoxin system RelE/ParE family toxin [Mesorhizobium sp.]
MPANRRHAGNGCVARPEVRAGLRTFPAGNYLVLYRQIEDGAEIVRVIHGARQWQELL